MTKLDRSFYTREDVVSIARELLGKVLVSQIDGERTAAIIVETEAYCGARDKACHAHLNRRTKRTEIMFAEGGKVYAYLCYGIHTMFNIVTNTEGWADAILVRGIEPLEGIGRMMERRKLKKLETRLTAGPALVSQAMGIQLGHYGEDLTEDILWLENRGVEIPEGRILAGPRVGIDYAEEDALLPWRFSVAGNPWVSPAK